MNGMYSSKPTWSISYTVIENPWLIKSGTINEVAQNNEIFPKLWCQKSSATRGIIAIESKMPTNGITQNIANPSPIKWGAEPWELSAVMANEGKKNNTNQTSRFKTIIVSK